MKSRFKIWGNLEKNFSNYLCKMPFSCGITPLMAAWNDRAHKSMRFDCNRLFHTSLSPLARVPRMMLWSIENVQPTISSLFMLYSIIRWKYNRRSTAIEFAHPMNVQTTFMLIWNIQFWHMTATRFSFVLSFSLNGQLTGSVSIELSNAWQAKWYQLRQQLFFSSFISILFLIGLMNTTILTYHHYIQNI